MKSSDLIERAKVISRGKRRPKSVDLRRSVSDVYYAVFHRLAAMAADTLVGSSRRRTEAWRRVYRALEHRRAKDEFRRLAVFSDRPLKTIAIVFVELQGLRHAADYDPAFSIMRRSDLAILISQAEAAIFATDLLDPAACLDLSTRLLFSERK